MVLRDSGFGSSLDPDFPGENVVDQVTSPKSQDTPIPGRTDDEFIPEEKARQTVRAQICELAETLEEFRITDIDPDKASEDVMRWAMDEEKGQGVVKEGLSGFWMSYLLKLAKARIGKCFVV